MDTEKLNQIYGILPELLKLRNDFKEVEQLFIEFDNNDFYHKTDKNYQKRMNDFCKDKKLNNSFTLDFFDFALFVEQTNRNYDKKPTGTQRSPFGIWS